MGNQDVVEPANEPEDSYQIITYVGQSLPSGKGSLKSLVLSRFMRSLRYGNNYFELIDSDPYFQVYEAYINSLLARPDTKVKFAVLSDDHDNVLGFVVIENHKLHYCHVQKDYRRQGIAAALCKEPFSVITHITHTGLTIWNNKFPLVKFNPFA